MLRKKKFFSCSTNVCEYVSDFLLLYVVTVMVMLRAMKKQSHETLEQRRPALIRGLENFGHFYLELKWDFHSWRMYNMCAC